MLKKHIYIDSKLSGSTGVMVMSHQKKLICANVGDSRAVLYRVVDESQLEFIPMSRDQKPSDPTERQRIIAHGGKVHPCRRRILLLQCRRASSSVLLVSGTNSVTYLA